MRDLRWLARRPGSAEYVMTRCPNHEDTTPSLAVYCDHAYSFCCGQWYSRAETLALFGKSSDADLPEIGEEAVAELREQGAAAIPASLVEVWHRSLVDRRSPLFPRLAEMDGRGLYRSTIRKARLGHTGSRFTIPIFGLGGRVLGVKYRRDDVYCDPEEPKYRAPRRQAPMVYRPFGGEGWATAIVEGEYDALLLGQYGVDAITSTGGAQSFAKVFKGWRFKQPVYVLTDQDDAGEEAYEQLRRVAVGALHRVRWRQGKDCTDALRDLDDDARRRRIEGWCNV